jgi:ABC-type phosphate transport system substrate-binding protein
MTRAALAAAGVAGVLLAVGFSGCGVEVGGDDSDSAAVQVSTPAEQRAQARRAASLPQRASGQLAIAGEHQGSLSSNAVRRFEAAQSAVHARYSAVGPNEGFARLCRGEVDIVDSARAISRAELAVCNANGLEIRTPIQIASDAIILATRNESDVGGDCLTVADIREIYRRDSPIDNWNDLGFDDLALTAAGPAQNANAFSNFTSQVLGVPSGATLSDLRGDYREHDSDDGIRKTILGESRLRRVPTLVEEQVRRARVESARQRRFYIGNLVAAARDRVLRQIAIQNRLRVRRKQPVKDPAALRLRNQHRVELAKNRARNRARRIWDARYDVLRAARTRELLARARRTGVIGFVRFSYYEAFEDQLRPMELDAGAARDAQVAAADARTRSAGLTPPTRLPAADKDGNRIPNCIFPSQQTITTGEYPLSRRILLYTSTSGLERPEVRAFLAYTLRNAQPLATETRLVPITNKLRLDQYRFVTGATPAPSEKPLPGEQTAARNATTTTTPAPAPAAAASTTTPAAASGSATTTQPAPAARPSSSVPGVSSDASTSAKESP